MDWHKVITKKNLIYPVALGMVVLFGIVYKTIGAQKYDGFEKIDDTNYESEELGVTSDVNDVEPTILTMSDAQVASIHIYLCGAVNKPGVYEVEYGTLLYDAINLAGGLREDAANDHINMVRSLDENISIYIPTVTDVDSNNYSGEVIMSDEVSDIETSESGNKDNGLININTADKSQLMSVPGIGEVTADAIINYRNTNGSFKSIDELMNVDGIGQGKFDKFRNYICV